MKTKIINTLYSLSLLLFIAAFGFQHNPPSGWYQQFVSLPPGSIINDMVFLDSLTGLIVTDRDTTNTSHVLKTTDGGENWFSTFTTPFIITKLQNLTEDIVYVGGARLFKTTDQGDSWGQVSTVTGIGMEGYYVLNEDTMWIVGTSAFDGGIFRSTDAGASWVRISGSPGIYNPGKIFFINEFTGFITPFTQSGTLSRTTDGGFTWNTTTGGVNGGGFGSIFFIDNNTGWKCANISEMYKTTNAGENWEVLPLPPKNDSIIVSKLNDFSVLNEDTIWAVGPRIFFGAGQIRGLIYVTTDGGNTWGLSIAGHINTYWRL